MKGYRTSIYWVTFPFISPKSPGDTTNGWKVPWVTFIVSSISTPGYLVKLSSFGLHCKLLRMTRQHQVCGVVSQIGEWSRSILDLNRSYFNSLIQHICRSCHWISWYVTIKFIVLQSWDNGKLVNFWWWYCIKLEPTNSIMMASKKNHL